MIERVPTILAVIPARGGSKGVPGKNLRVVAGKPLIVHTIETARQLQNRFHRIVVSTDDERIAAVARESGADVPFLRPPELADDRAPTLPVLQHATAFVESQDHVRLDWVCLLQPTAPLRSAEDIEAAWTLAAQGECDSVISVVQVWSHHPILMKRIANGRLVPFCIEEQEGTRRQDYQPPAYMRNGAIYLTRREVLMEQNSIWGRVIRPYVMPEERSVNVDSELDLQLVDYLLQKRRSAHVQDQVTAHG